MCGIAGFYFKNINPEPLARKINADLLHRGPDAQNFWIDSDTGVTLIHNRLSIIDLSVTANQPMISESGKFILVFNGEIYNYQEIRKYLDSKFNSIQWKTNSDTEVLLKGIELLGVGVILALSYGMFAFAVYNNETKDITLARDRFGEKPLFYSNFNNSFSFASEMKIFKNFDTDFCNISTNKVREFLQFGFIQNGETYTHLVNKVKPGSYLVYNINNKSLQEKGYWDFKNFKSNKSINGDVDSLSSLISDSVKNSMISDVPIGSFLSGGIDSSLITSIMVNNSSSKIHTFSIGFENSELSEAKSAKEIAEFLGTTHHEKIIEPKELIHRVPSILSTLDEPLADSSYIPTYILSEFASNYVKVALSGDGGDEIFLGYNRYFQNINLLNELTFGNKIHYKILKEIITKIPNQYLTQIIDTLSGKKFVDISKKIAVVKRVISSKSFAEYNENIRSKWDFKEPNIEQNNHILVKNKVDLLIDYISNYDISYYLPDDILTKVDRASMQFSLETRAPFLYPTVAEYGISLNLEHKMNNNKGKLILKQLLSKYVPKHLWERPKQGFGLPISEWLRTDLKDWLFSLLNSDNDIFKIIDKKSTMMLFEKHISKSENYSEELWALASFLTWKTKNNIQIN